MTKTHCSHCGLGWTIPGNHAFTSLTCRSLIALEPGFDPNDRHDAEDQAHYDELCGASRHREGV